MIWLNIVAYLYMFNKQNSSLTSARICIDIQIITLIKHVESFLPEHMTIQFWYENLDPLHAKFFRGNKNIYLFFMSFLHIDMTQVVEILPQVR